jgi:hypothetical protein
VCVWRVLDCGGSSMCRWQLLLERGLDVVGHLQLDFTASCANGTARVHWLLPLDYEAGPLSFQRWRVLGVLLLEQKAATMKTTSASLTKTTQCHGDNQGAGEDPACSVAMWLAA